MFLLNKKIQTDLGITNLDLFYWIYSKFVEKNIDFQDYRTQTRRSYRIEKYIEKYS